MLLTVTKSLIGIMIGSKFTTFEGLSTDGVGVGFCNFSSVDD